MITKFLLRSIIMLAPMTVQAQYSQETAVNDDPPLTENRTNTQRSENTGSGGTLVTAPYWAKAKNYSNKTHVYFPDYHVFYTPGKGYTYWNDKTWELSAAIPAFLQKTNLEQAKAVMLGTDLQKAPELDYIKYREQYPAGPVDILIPVPSL